MKNTFFGVIMFLLITGVVSAGVYKSVNLSWKYDNKEIVSTGVNTEWKKDLTSGKITYMGGNITRTQNNDLSTVYTTPTNSLEKGKNGIKYTTPSTTYEMKGGNITYKTATSTLTITKDKIIYKTPTTTKEINGGDWKVLNPTSTKGN